LGFLCRDSYSSTMEHMGVRPSHGEFQKVEARNVLFSPNLNIGTL